MFINLASVPGGQLVNSPTAQSLKRYLQPYDTTRQSKRKNSIRRQLTLFLQDNFETIEKIRQRFNPKQYELINAHVTLCREDEIENLDQILNNLSSLNGQKITIQFECPTRFDNGKGVFLKAHSDLKEFEKLRQKIL